MRPLPSGNVLSAAGENRTSDYEVFRPSYNACGMFQPVITAAPSAISYGVYPYTVTFQSLPVGLTITDVVLMRPGSVTHHFDMSQRYHKLASEPGTNPQTTIRFAAPPHAGWAPRGWYMLFLVTNVGGVSYMTNVNGIKQTAWILLS